MKQTVEIFTLKSHSFIQLCSVFVCYNVCKMAIFWDVKFKLDSLMMMYSNISLHDTKNTPHNIIQMKKDYCLRSLAEYHCNFTLSNETGFLIIPPRPSIKRCSRKKTLVFVSRQRMSMKSKMFSFHNYYSYSYYFSRDHNNRQLLRILGMNFILTQKMSRNFWSPILFLKVLVHHHKILETVTSFMKYPLLLPFYNRQLLMQKDTNIYKQ